MTSCATPSGGIASLACNTSSSIRRSCNLAEPHLDRSLVGGLHYTDAVSVTDPGALVAGYAAYFERLGGRFLTGDATSLEAEGDGWRVMTQDGPVSASSAVIALGPWAKDVTSALGYKLPLAVKRGYHMHYAPQPGTVLNHPVLDVDNGFLLAPMARGIRLTTGVELADRDAPKTPCATDARRALGAYAVPARRAGRRRTVDGPASVYPRHDADHWPRTASQDHVVCVRTRASRADARRGDRAADRVHDDGGGTVRRCHAVQGRPL
jgi:glycine/D-amino acid oxidase-like deaminating enzyme